MFPPWLPRSWPRQPRPVVPGYVVLALDSHINGVTQYVCFLIWRFSFSIMFSVSPMWLCVTEIHFCLLLWSTLLCGFIAIYLFFLPLKYFGCFSFGYFEESCSEHLCTSVPLKMLLFLLGKYLEMGFLGYVVSRWLPFRESTKPFSQSDIPLNILTNSVSEFQLLQILANTWYGQIILTYSRISLWS